MALYYTTGRIESAVVKGTSGEYYGVQWWILAKQSNDEWLPKDWQPFQFTDIWRP
jgi:hypothetical protein